jgi:hypothetical protein
MEGRAEEQQAFAAAERKPGASEGMFKRMKEYGF